MRRKDYVWSKWVAEDEVDTSIMCVIDRGRERFLISCIDFACVSVCLSVNMVLCVLDASKSNSM